MAATLVVIADIGCGAVSFRAGRSRVAQSAPALPRCLARFHLGRRSWTKQAACAWMHMDPFMFSMDLQDSRRYQRFAGTKRALVLRKLRSCAKAFEAGLGLHGAAVAEAVLEVTRRGLLHKQPRHPMRYSSPLFSIWGPRLLGPSNLLLLVRLFCSKGTFYKGL